MITSAIIVTYNPPAGFLENLDHWSAQLDQLLIVDNGSMSEVRDLFRRVNRKNKGDVEFILNETNLGVATALNQGFSWAIKQGLDFVFVFDHDSHPAPGMVITNLNTFNSYPNRERIAIVAPMIEDPVAGIPASYLRPRGRYLYKRTTYTNRILEDVSIVITSGALYNLKAYQKIGPFRDDFFIDYVDTEYCLRAKQNGYNIVVNCNARLYHRLGNQQTRMAGPFTMHPTFHSPLRWYYISRNRIPMFRLYGFRFPHWLLYEMVTNSYGLVRLLLFEDQKVSKVLAMILGALDGLYRRMGPISDSRKDLIARND